MQTQWQQPVSFPQIKQNEVHIWKIDLTKTTLNSTHLHEILPITEQYRANNLTITKVKNNFIISRGMVRVLLSKYTKQNPEQLIFKENQYGKNFLQNPSNLYFNVSHANNLFLFAFSVEKQIGIDVEFARNTVDIEGIAKRFFAPEEISDLLKLPSENQKQAFFNCWSRKEAFIKAIGLGLSYELKKFSVDVVSTGTAQVKININDPEYAKQNWHLFSFEPKENYTGALAVNFLPKKILFYEYLERNE